jgi:hypothetical protein
LLVPVTDSRAQFYASTMSPWVASLCERAQAQGLTVRVVWRATKWGPELENVSLT